MAFRTRIVVIVAPLAYISGLTAAAVSNLALSSLDTHRFEWAAGGSSGALRAIVSFGALAERRVRSRIETFQADVASDTLVNFQTGSAVHLVATLFTCDCSSCLIGEFVSSRRAKRLPFDTKIASRSWNASDWVNRL